MQTRIQYLVSSILYLVFGVFMYIYIYFIILNKSRLKAYSYFVVF